MDKENIIQTAFQQDDTIYNKKIEPVVAPAPEIGVDVDNNLIHDLIDATAVEQVDISKLQSFTAVSRTRNELYDTLDYMAQDTTLASVLETYAEDATEMNDDGHIVWVESDDSNVSKYIGYLLNSLGVDKNVFKWTYSLCKYGDVYLRLYRESEVEDRFFSKKEDDINTKRKNILHEDVNVRAYKKGDSYIHYLEQAPNPAQLFELTRFGKTSGYLKTKVNSNNSKNDFLNSNSVFNMYKFNTDSNDIDLYPATEWVHGCLEDDSSRNPEEVELFTDIDGTEQNTSYKVRRGQSLLYDSYKTWRELMLLENSVLLQRVTQSSIVRVIGVEVGDMPKENVQPHLMNIKQLIEQKAAINVGNNISEYSNPGPIVNNIYIPTRNNQGVLSTQQIGGDVNIGELVDLDYYENKLFGGLRVPKQYFGRVDDAAGFSGGTSLSIISSRYAKMIKRIQNVIIQMLTDAINLILIDTDNQEYINKFKLRMLAPTTQEEVDRRDNVSSKVGLVSDIMNSLTDVEDVNTRLKILKSLLSDTLTNTEVISLIQDQIDLNETTSEETIPDLEDSSNTESNELFSDSEPMNFGSDGLSDSGDFDFNIDEPSEETSSEENNLPSPEDLGIGDLSDTTNPELEK